MNKSLIWQRKSVVLLIILGIISTNITTIAYTISDQYEPVPTSPLAAFAPPQFLQPQNGRVYWMNNRSSAYIYLFDVINFSVVLSRSFTINVSHPDIDNVSKIELFIDGIFYGEISNASYQWDWDATGYRLLQRIHELKAIATNMTGTNSSTLVYSIKFP